MTDEENKFAQIAQEENSVRKKLRFVAFLSRQIKLRGRSLLPVLVGGGAVEVYTAGNYSTKDIDLVYDDSKILDKILIPLGFEKDGRYWYSNEADIILECPGSELPRRTQLVRLGEGEEALVISLEEIIIDRLCAFKFWKSEKDGEWARTILGGSANIVDVDFLRKTAIEEDVLDSLEQILAEKG